MRDGHHFLLFLFILFFLCSVIYGSCCTFRESTNCSRTSVWLRQTFRLKQPAVRESWPHPSECQSFENISTPGAHSATRKQSGGIPCTTLGFFDHFKVNDVILSTHACSKPVQLASGICSCATKRYRKGRSNSYFSVLAFWFIRQKFLGLAY